MKRSPEIRMVRVRQSLLSSGEQGSCRAGEARVRQKLHPTTVNMFPTSLPKQFVVREGEAPAEPLHRWLGRSLALPKVFNGIDFAKMFTSVASPSQVMNCLSKLHENMLRAEPRLEQ